MKPNPGVHQVAASLGELRRRVEYLEKELRELRHKVGVPVMIGPHPIQNGPCYTLGTGLPVPPFSGGDDMREK